MNDDDIKNQKPEPGFVQKWGGRPSHDLFTVDKTIRLYCSIYCSSDR